MQQLVCGFLEVKAAEAGTDMSFFGYGSVFGIEDDYGDVVLKGAFAESIAAAKAGGGWPVMLWQHGFERDGVTPIGIWM